MTGATAGRRSRAGSSSSSPRNAAIGPRLAERRLQLLARRHQRLGHEAPAELAEPAEPGRLAHQRRSSARSLVATSRTGSSSSAEVRHGGGGPGPLDEALDLERVLLARRRLDAGRHVDAPRRRRSARRRRRCPGSSPPARIMPHPLGHLADQRPVEELAGAGRRPVEQDRVGGQRRRPRRSAASRRGRP